MNEENIAVLKHLLIYGVIAALILLISLPLFRHIRREPEKKRGSLIYTAGSPEIHRGILGWCPLKKDYRIKLPARIRSDDSPLTIIRLNKIFFLRLGKETEVLIEPTYISISKDDLPDLTLETGRIWVDKPPNKMLRINFSFGNILLFGTQAEVIISNRGCLLITYRGKARLKSSITRLPGINLKSRMIGVLRKEKIDKGKELEENKPEGIQPEVKGKLSADDIDDWRGFNLSLSLYDIDNFDELSKAEQLDSTASARDMRYFRKPRPGSSPSPTPPPSRSAVAQLPPPPSPYANKPVPKPTGTMSSLEKWQHDRLQKIRIKGQPPEISFPDKTPARKPVRHSIPVRQSPSPRITNRNDDNMKNDDNIKNDEDEKKEELFIYDFPSYLSHSGIDELPDYTPVPWSSGPTEIIKSKSDAEDAFDLVMSGLDSDFGIKLNNPYDFIFVPKDDMSVLKGSNYDKENTFGGSEAEMSTYEYDEENKIHKFYLLEGLEKHEAYNLLAGLIGQAWVNEYVPDKRRDIIEQYFRGWLGYKFSYNIKDYYNARASKEGFGAPNVVKMLKIEEEHGEHGIFEEVLGKTNYLKLKL